MLNYLWMAMLGIMAVWTGVMKIAERSGQKGLPVMKCVHF